MINKYYIVKDRGEGKTTQLIAQMSSLLLNNPEAHVLMVAPNAHSKDDLIRRVCDVLSVGSMKRIDFTSANATGRGRFYDAVFVDDSDRVIDLDAYMPMSKEFYLTVTGYNITK